MSQDSFQLSKTPAQNNRPVPNGLPENMNRTDVNNAVREFMSMYRTFIDDPEWLDLMRESDGDALVVSKDGDYVLRVAAANMTAYFNAGRRIKLSGGGDVEGTVVSATFPGPDTTVTVALVGGVVIPAGTTKVELYIAKSLKSGAFGSGHDMLVNEVFS